MARDDYHVVVYQILAYLYTKLKAGEAVEKKFLLPDSVYLGINEHYWNYIMVNLLNYGFITGITVTNSWGKEVIISDLEYCQITPTGIEYLCDNSFMAKAVSFLKDAKAIVPFV